MTTDIRALKAGASVVDTPDFNDLIDELLGGAAIGTITEVTSNDASVTVTNPHGPIVDLSAAAGSHMAVAATLPTSPAAGDMVLHQQAGVYTPLLWDGGAWVQFDTSAYTVLTVPGAPTLTGATAGDTQVVLTWTAPASNGGSTITGYKVYRGTSSGTETLLTTLGVVLTHTDTGRTNGVTYYYKVTAVNAIGEGTLSNELSATPAAPAGMTLLDNFNRADGALGSNWGHPNVGAATAIVSNRAQSPGTEQTAIWTAASFAANQECGFDIGLVGSTDPHYYLLLNVTAVAPTAFTGYLVDYYKFGSNYKIDVYRANSGTFTGVIGAASGLAAFTPGDFLSAHKVGGLITVKSNGTTQLSFTDPSPLSSGGYAGFGLRTTATVTSLAIDNFKGGSL